MSKNNGLNIFFLYFNDIYFILKGFFLQHTIDNILIFITIRTHTYPKKDNWNSHTNTHTVPPGSYKYTSTVKIIKLQVYWVTSDEFQVLCDNN